MDTMLALITHPIFPEHDPGCHPECPQRLEAIDMEIGKDPELSERIDRLEPMPAPDEAILRCHTERHLKALEAVRGSSGSFDPDTRYSPMSIEAARRAAGAAMLAVDTLLDGSRSAAFALVRPPGHHACPDRAMGFCLINNAAVAARHARARGVERVLIVDFDVHHGNGTQDIFYEDPSVYYYSLHLHHHYPGTGRSEERGAGNGAGTTLNRPLPQGFPSDHYREIYARDVEQIVDSFKPEMAILSAGFDSHRLDPLGGLMLESEDFWVLAREVSERMPEGRVLSTLEGGYNLSVLGEAVRLHLRGLSGLSRQ